MTVSDQSFSSRYFGRFIYKSFENQVDAMTIMKNEMRRPWYAPTRRYVDTHLRLPSWLYSLRLFTLVARCKICTHFFYGCMVVWMYGCMDVWLYGCMDVWMYGCMDVWVKAHIFSIQLMLFSWLISMLYPFQLISSDQPYSMICS